MFGCDPHQTITQVRDTLPYLRRDVNRIEIPFVAVNTTLGSAGISFLDILFKCAEIMHRHCDPPPQLNSHLETVILRVPTHGGIYCHKLKYRCVSGALTYCDLALFVVRIVLELLKVCRRCPISSLYVMGTYLNRSRNSYWFMVRTIDCTR
ncbi:hypothetical protein M378DRAFT_283804 [Amanita muscaria Koide BX008]|uniref:Uncharacterized protein n=1 Tax=Amanita muscaria (strain Koide BX008) TaxID=946122 RepID=A0A0C2WQN2_AMAMK|nr:hypothetical protein M378DRAFT_283804 [Amanita muscaria Koide BX008]